MINGLLKINFSSSDSVHRTYLKSPGKGYLTNFRILYCHGVTTNQGMKFLAFNSQNRDAQWDSMFTVASTGLNLYGSMGRNAFGVRFNATDGIESSVPQFYAFTKKRISVDHNQSIPIFFFADAADIAQEKLIIQYAFVPAVNSELHSQSTDVPQVRTNNAVVTDAGQNHLLIALENMYDVEIKTVGFRVEATDSDGIDDAFVKVFKHSDNWDQVDDDSSPEGDSSSLGEVVLDHGQFLNPYERMHYGVEHDDEVAIDRHTFKFGYVEAGSVFMLLVANVLGATNDIDLWQMNLHGKVARSVNRMYRYYCYLESPNLIQGVIV